MPTTSNNAPVQLENPLVSAHPQPRPDQPKPVQKLRLGCFGGEREATERELEPAARLNGGGRGAPPATGFTALRSHACYPTHSHSPPAAGGRAITHLLWRACCTWGSPPRAALSLLTLLCSLYAFLGKGKGKGGEEPPQA